MDFKQIQELIRMINKSQIGELRIEDKDGKVVIKSLSQIENQARIEAGYSYMPPMAAPVMIQSDAPKAAQPIEAPAPQNTASDQPKTTATPPAAESKLLTIKSPMIGTFYRAGGPDKEPFVKVGDTISVGKVICVIEAMKLFNEIEAEVSGKVVKILIDNASPVEYDQPLFLVEPA